MNLSAIRKAIATAVSGFAAVAAVWIASGVFDEGEVWGIVGTLAAALVVYLIPNAPTP